MKKEKENAIIELLKQSKSYSQIEQQLHVSSRDIAHTKKKYEEERKKVEEEQNKVQILKTSQALSLFEQANTPVQVAIELDLVPDEADILYKVYCRMNGRAKLNEIYDKLGDKLSAFIELYEHIEKEGMDIRQVVNLLKVAEEIPNLQAERQHIEDCIDEDWPKLFELKREKQFLAKVLQGLHEQVEFAREHTDNKLKSMQEVASALEHTNIELNIQKGSLVHELDKYKASFASELKSLQVGLDNRKQEEQRLTSRIELLKNEELEILRRSKQQEQFIQESQSQPQLGYHQPVHQENPNLLAEELRVLAIPVICNNWERKWEELMHHGATG
jgi:hypothetical protein